MPRKRKPEDQWMPQRVYKGRSAYEFKPVDGGTVRLCSIEAKQSEVWQAYEKYMAIANNKNTVQHLVDTFFDSADYRDLAQHTRKDYKKYSKKVLSAFGKMDPNAVTPVHVRKFMDILGQKSPVQANRHKAFLSRVFRWAYERGKVQRNPCQGVKKFKEKARDRYIEDYEYDQICFSYSRTRIW